MTIAQQFLTQLDPNARVKGSRDPLGTLGVWSGFGRRVVGNLTTQTTSLIDFRLLVLGSWLVQDDDNPTHSFLVWEQLCGYARALNGDTGFRGVTRVQRRRQEGATVTVSGDRSAQILNNQAMYGVWGLYRAASWRCGLLNREAPTVPAPVSAMVESVYVPRLTEAWGSGLGQLRTWLRDGHELRPGTAEHRRKLAAIHRCIAEPLVDSERDLLRRALVHGGPPHPAATNGQVPQSPDDESGAVRERQRELAERLTELKGLDTALSWLAREHHLDLAERSSDDLAEALRWIVACESVIAPSAAIFSFLSKQDGVKIDEVADQLRGHFADVPHLLTPEHRELWRHIGVVAPRLLRAPSDPDGTGADRWLHIADALHGKQLHLLAELLIAQNAAVSRDRGGARGWVMRGTNGRLQVSLVDRSWEGLPSGGELLATWINPYFLPNLRAMALATQGPQ